MSVIRSARTKFIDVVKIDVEGSEYGILPEGRLVAANSVGMSFR